MQNNNMNTMFSFELSDGMANKVTIFKVQCNNLEQIHSDKYICLEKSLQ